MPLKKGKSKEIRDKNIREMIAAGHPQDQAIAAAYDVQKESKKKAIAKRRKSRYTKASR